VDKIRRTVIIPNQAIATYVTEWRYDTWNRLTEMIYPDLEKITYSYNIGGQLESVKGQKSYSYNYVNKIGYDKFEQRIYMKYCNGAETNYTYDSERRRVTHLNVVSTKSNTALMSNAYTFDAVDNVLSVTNTAPMPTAGMSGQMSHTYNYDGLYRLVSAAGTYAGAGNKTAAYTLDMQYDNMHNIVSKKQHIQQSNIVFDGTLKAGYNLTYNYGSPFKISSLKDENYRTEGDEQKDKTVNEHAYQYDANGNLVYVNTAKEKRDGSSPEGRGERKYLWDEENRLQAVNINGFISSYLYDASGERVIKASGDDEGMYVNGLFSGARTSTDNFTAYINPYLVVSKGGNYTKHIYMGSQRIVSKLGDLDSYGQDPRRIAYAGSDVDGASVDFANKYTQSQQTVKDRYADFEVPYNGKDNDDYVNGGGFCCDDNPNLRAGAIGNGNDNPELYQYYYHSDHLGSSSLITNLDGEVVQHIEYVPFGEVFIEERNNKWNTPYLFNAKELDEETGLYYYGARYYDSRISVWLGCDPMWEKYPGMSSYAFCFNNPILYFDPTGMTGKISIYCAGTNSTRTSKDEGQFRYEANREVTWGLTTNSYSGRTTTSFLQTLRDVTAAEGEIEYLSIYSHSGSQYLFLDNGQYGKEAITNKSLNPSWNKLGLTDLINDADINFSSNALVVFAGCYAGKTENSDGQNIYSIAKDFTAQSGVASIGATNSTYPSSKDKIRTVDRGQYALFYKDTDGNVQQMLLGNKLNKETIQKAKDFIDNLNQ
jgi:RHS repeat-associated protein